MLTPSPKPALLPRSRPLDPHSAVLGGSAGQTDAWCTPPPRAGRRRAMARAAHDL